MEYDATTTKIFGIAPYQFFAGIGIVFASSAFILLLLKYNHNILRYTAIFFLSGIGMLIGAKLFGLLTGLYIALASGEKITLNTFLNTGIVFYGGLFGFIAAFLIISKIWNKKIDYKIIDILAVCIPLFHLWARVGCFFAGCCYGMESHSFFSIAYTTHVGHEIITASRFPIQLVEAFLNAVIFTVLLMLLFKNKFKGRILIVYLIVYAALRIALEFFRGDLARGVWNGISFSQAVSVIVLILCVFKIIIKFLRRGPKNETH